MDKCSCLLPPPSQTTICVVCMDHLYDGNKITRLPCHHYFHRACIHQWLSHKKSCPTCRCAIKIRTKPTLAYIGRHHATPLGNVHVTHVNYHKPSFLWVYQLMELFESLFLTEIDRWRVTNKIRYNFELGLLIGGVQQNQVFKIAYWQ